MYMDLIHITKVRGSGDQSRDFIFIDDVIDALCLLIEKGMNCGVIQIGSGEATTIKSLINKIINISKKNITPIFDITKPEGDKGRIADYEKAKKILNWSPKVDLDKGLEITYRWIEEQVRKSK